LLVALADTSPLAPPGARGGLGAPPGAGAAALGLAGSALEADLEGKVEPEGVVAAAGPLPEAESRARAIFWLKAPLAYA